MAAMASLYVLAVMFAVAVQGDQAPSTQDVLKSIVLSDDDHKDAFNGLDIKRNEQIDQEDLKNWVYHPEGEFLKTKIFQMIDTKPDQIITRDELKAFLNKRPVTYAVHECHYIRSLSLREYCFADQILTYCYLALPEGAVKALFDKINVDKNSDICPAEVAELANVNTKFTESEQKNFMLEIGGTDNKISIQELGDYLNNEELLDDFRRCRRETDGCTHKYDPDCMLEELIDFTMTHVTNLDAATVFDQIRKNPNMYIEKNDVKGLTDLCDDATADNFIRLMDKSKPGTPGKDKVSFGEFRAYIMSHTVKMHLQRACAEPLVTQGAELDCYKTQIAQYAKENHTPIWLRVPDLDMLFTFEELDVTNDGQISKDADLIKRKWDTGLAQRFIDEIDGKDEDKKVNLEEFNEFVDQPHMVFGMADCLGEQRENRVQCYENELKKMLTDMLDKTVIKGFFDFLDKDDDKDIEADDLKAHGIEGPEAENFLNELGMGDQKVTPYEFFWFNSQQELSKMYRDDKCAHENALLKTLLKYLAEKMTEYDILELFLKLDTNKNYELETCDFNADKTKVEKLLKRMDQEDRDTTVNLVEFWLYLNRPIGTPRKLHLEQHCTKPKTTQAEEIECYKKEILEVGAKEQ